MNRGNSNLPFTYPYFIPNPWMKHKRKVILQNVQAFLRTMKVNGVRCCRAPKGHNTFSIEVIHVTHTVFQVFLSQMITSEITYTSIVLKEARALHLVYVNKGK